MCLALYKFMSAVLVTFFAIELWGLCYSVRSLKSKLWARVECEQVLHKLQSFVIIFFHTAQITWQLDGAQYSEMFTFEAMVASHDMMISPPKRYNYRNPPGLFMYSPPHAQRTLKISSIKNCALLLYGLCRQFPKDIFQKYLWKMAGVCYI